MNPAMMGCSTLPSPSLGSSSSFPFQDVPQLPATGSDPTGTAAQREAKWRQMHNQASILQAMADQLDRPSQGFTRVELEAMAEQVKQMHSNVENMLQVKTEPPLQDSTPPLHEGMMPGLAASAAFVPPEHVLPSTVEGDLWQEERPANSPTNLRSEPAKTKAGSLRTEQSMEGGSRKNQKESGSLRNFLNDLHHEDMRCVFIARGVKQLGFKSKQILERHYAEYGEISHVFVPTSKTKANLRPGNLGVVLMRSPESVARILAAGPEQWIKGVQVQVSTYERPPAERQLDRAELEAKVRSTVPETFDAQVPLPGLFKGDGGNSGPSNREVNFDPHGRMQQLNAQASSQQADPSVMAEMTRQLSNLQTVLNGINNMSMEPGKMPQDEMVRAMAVLGMTRQQLGHLGQSCQQMAFKEEAVAAAMAGASMNLADADLGALPPLPRLTGINAGGLPMAAASAGQFGQSFGNVLASGVGASMLLAQSSPQGYPPPPPQFPCAAYTRGVAGAPPPVAAPPYPPRLHVSGATEDLTYDNFSYANDVNGADTSSQWTRFTSPGDDWWG